MRSTGHANSNPYLLIAGGNFPSTVTCVKGRFAKLLRYSEWGYATGAGAVAPGVTPAGSGEAAIGVFTRNCTATYPNTTVFTTVQEAGIVEVEYTGTVRARDLLTPDNLGRAVTVTSPTTQYVAAIALADSRSEDKYVSALLVPTAALPAPGASSGGSSSVDLTAADNPVAEHSHNPLASYSRRMYPSLYSSWDGTSYLGNYRFDLSPGRDYTIVLNTATTYLFLPSPVGTNPTAASGTAGKFVYTRRDLAEGGNGVTELPDLGGMRVGHTINLLLVQDEVGGRAIALYTTVGSTALTSPATPSIATSARATTLVQLTWFGYAFGWQVTGTTTGTSVYPLMDCSPTSGAPTYVRSVWTGSGARPSGAQALVNAWATYVPSKLRKTMYDYGLTLEIAAAGDRTSPASMPNVAPPAGIQGLTDMAQGTYAIYVTSSAGSGWDNYATQASLHELGHAFDNGTIRSGKTITVPTNNTYSFIGVDKVNYRWSTLNVDSTFTGNSGVVRNVYKWSDVPEVQDLYAAAQAAYAANSSGFNSYFLSNRMEWFAQMFGGWLWYRGSGTNDTTYMRLASDTTTISNWLTYANANLLTYLQ